MRRSTTTGFRKIASYAIEVESAKLIPLGEDHHGVRTFDAGIGIGLGGHLRQELARLRHGGGIIGAHVGALGHQHRKNGQARRLPHIVGIGLERQSENSEPLAADAAAAGRHDLLHHGGFARAVHADHRLHDSHRRPVALPDGDQSGGVLGEAGAAETGAGMQELRSDPAVEPHAARDLLHVGADLLAELRHLVDEGDLGGQEGVRRILDQLRGSPAGEHHRGFIDVQGSIKLGHEAARTLVLGADHHAVRTLEVLDRGALAQEFRVRHHGEFRVRAQLAHDGVDLVAGADRNGRLGRDDREPVELGGDLARRVVHEAQIRKAVTPPRRRADGDEHGIGGIEPRDRIRSQTTSGRLRYCGQ